MMLSATCFSHVRVEVSDWTLMTCGVSSSNDTAYRRPSFEPEKLSVGDKYALTLTAPLSNRNTRYSSRAAFVPGVWLGAVTGAVVMPELVRPRSGMRSHWMTPASTARV